MRFFTALAFLPGLLLPVAALAQSVGINTTTASPPASAAALDVRAGTTAKGVLFPSVALALDNTGVTSPPTGLMVYNTNPALPCGAGLYFNNGTAAVPAWLCFTKQVQTYHAYDTGGRTSWNPNYLQQPGCVITVVIPTGQTADIKVDAAIGALVTDGGSAAYSTLDAYVALDDSYLAKGGVNRFTLENSINAYAQGGTTLSTWAVGVGAGTHTLKLYTGLAAGSSQVKAGGNASNSVNAGEIHASVYYR